MKVIGVREDDKGKIFSWDHQAKYYDLQHMNSFLLCVNLLVRLTLICACVVHGHKLGPI